MKEKRIYTAAIVFCILCAAVCGFFFGLYLNNPVTANETETDGNLSIVQIAQNSADTVVEIATETTVYDSRMRQYVSEGAGSGVIISADGVIVTNNHVIDGASKITVRLRSGKEYEAKLLGADNATDLAVVKIDANNLKYAVFGDSDALLVGETAVAIGNPLGELGGTVTEGIISAKDRTIVIDNQEMTLLQTSAAINPGNSGGGLFNDQGALIGIVNAKFADTGIEGLGFAIPINVAKPIISQLKDHGYVTGRPALGIEVALGESSYLSYYFHVNRTGLFVMRTADETHPLKPWDRIVSIDNQVINTYEDLTALLKTHKIGDKVSIKIIRNYEEMTVTTTIIEQKPF